MLITESTRTIVEVIAAAVGVVGGVVAIRRRKRSSSSVPTARLNANEPIGARVLRLLPLLTLPLGIAGFLWARSHSIEVLLVRDGHSVLGDRVVEKRLASSPLGFPVAQGDGENTALFGEPCWTVNASSRPIRVVQIEYTGRGGHLVETESLTVMPGQRVGDCFYDYFGPRFGPPETWSAMANQSPFNELGVWLTWTE